jgi:nucleoside-diphosphate-sugar epimerase
MTELGRILARRPRPDGVRFNLAGQQANTLLHDGHAWKGFARSALAGARRALRGDAGMLVHASFAFVRELPPKDPLRSLAEVILECESLVLAGPMPSCVVRLGYLYGPGSRDLKAYRTAFRLGRPYWSGPSGTLQYHLHVSDAAGALAAAAKRQNAGKIFYATDGHPVPFMAFMDHFARKVGRRHPLHAPLFSKPLMKLVVREEHMQQVALGMPVPAPAPRVPGWKPVVTDYREALDRIVESWPA